MLTFAAPGHQASAQLLVGDAVRQISDHARDFEADLIIVQHVQEKSLLRRWWSGSTAKSLVELHGGQLTIRDLRNLETKVPLDTLKLVVDRAVEIGREGREGKPVGTLSHITQSSSTHSPPPSG